MSETKQNRGFVQNFQVHFGYDYLVTVDPIGRSGGLALFYNNEFQVKKLYQSNRMIDVEAVALGKKGFSHFCLWRPSSRVERSSLGKTEKIWFSEIGAVVYNWGSK